MDGRHSMPIVLSEYVMTRTQCLKIAPKSHIYLFMFNTLLDRDSVASLKPEKLSCFVNSIGLGEFW